MLEFCNGAGWKSFDKSYEFTTIQISSPGNYTNSADVYCPSGYRILTRFLYACTAGTCHCHVKQNGALYARSSDGIARCRGLCIKND